MFFIDYIPKRKCKFNGELKKKIVASQLGEMKMKQCVICRTFMSVGNRGSYDSEACMNTAHIHTHEIHICRKTKLKTEKRAVTTGGGSITILRNKRLHR